MWSGKHVRLLARLSAAMKTRSERFSQRPGFDAADGVASFILRTHVVVGNAKAEKPEAAFSSELLGVLTAISGIPLARNADRTQKQFPF
jgi:hypothetical protein